MAGKNIGRYGKKTKASLVSTNECLQGSGAAQLTAYNSDLKCPLFAI